MVNRSTEASGRHYIDITTIRAKREAEIITDTAYEEFTRLTDQAEELHADRMTALAKCRGVSLATLLEQLGMHCPEYV